MDVRVLNETEIRGLIGPAEALAAVRDAFAAFAQGRATLPDALGLEFPDREGEAHVKGAYLHDAPYWSIKAATGFYRNPERGLPVTGGVSLVFSATTGLLDTLLFDNGYLTELRTGAAGALAADLLAKPEIEQVLIVGSGGQARYQLTALLLVRRPRRVVAFGRRSASAQAYVDEMRGQHDLDIAIATDLADAVAGSDLIVTTTPARSPIIQAAWLRPGVHLTAMGSDFPEKQEIDVAALARADLVVADHPQQALLNGEVHHAVAAGAIRADDVVALGAIVSGTVPGRTDDNQITIADLTGLGIQDAAVAAAVVDLATQRDVGRQLAM